MFVYESSVRLKMRRTKIVATIGWASRSETMLRKLISGGLNVARLNFSHGTIAEHKTIIARIRKVAKELGKNVAILGDLCGPKIRVGKFEDGKVQLVEGASLKVVTDQVVGTAQVIQSQYKYLASDVEIGQSILLDDGKLELRVDSIDSTTQITCSVLRGGVLSDRKGMNLPGTTLTAPALTDKDIADLAVCIEDDLDYVAISFVRTADEVTNLKKRIDELTTRFFNAEHPRTRVIAKIEKPQAIANITEIVHASDGVMIARGDLGVEMPLEKVPLIQQQLIKLANQHHKPVIVATQLLESMMTASRPTRAEVSDVAKAVWDMTDAVMLSGETAAGDYPMETLSVMDRVIREIECFQWEQGKLGQLQSDISIYPVANALARACTLLSQDMEIRALNGLTRTGRTVRMLSIARPNAPIIAYCAAPKVVHQMQLFWGVCPRLVAERLTHSQFAQIANQTVLDLKFAVPGQFHLLVAMPPTGPYHTNSIALAQVE